MKAISNKKQKRINRLELVDFIRKIQGLKFYFQEGLTGKNFYFIGNDKDEPYYQMEFIPQSRMYFFTIYLRGLQTEGGADTIHDEVVNYLKKLDLERNIILDTETRQTLI
jgi:hypothetical protein